MQTSWIWHDESTNGVMGAEYDKERAVIHWFDEPGCACSDSDMEQTVADFLERGPHPLTPPDELIQEMQRALREQAVGAN